MKAPIFSRLFYPTLSTFLLRIWCGVIFIRYGLSVLHLDSIEDFASSLSAAKIPLPYLGAWLCKSTEFFGGIFLVFGFLKKPAILLLMIDMTVATFLFHHGQVLNNGLTSFLLLLCLINIFFTEPDFLSIDYLIFRTNAKS
jgi:putative oxidoreductase